MQPRHRVSRAAILLIKRFEGYRQAAAQLPDGRWTIGHGHTLTARQGAQVSPDDAEALLLYDLIGVAHALNEAVFTPLSQNQFDALASFTFNVGLDSFHQSSVLKRLNEGALIQAACSMDLWRKAIVGGERIVIDALIRRRSAEKTLFLTPEGDAWVPAPSPILQPLLDTDAQDIVPLGAPVEVTAVLEGDQLVVQRQGEPAPLPAAPDDEEESPAKSAAEAVTARLSTIFQENSEPPTPEELAEAEADRVALLADPHPQADFAPPPELEAEPEPEPEPQPEPEPEPEAEPAEPVAPEAFEDPVPFFLRAPDPEGEPTAAEKAPQPEAPDEEDGPDSDDLFSPPPAETPAFNGFVDEAETDARERQRFIIDDQTPYEFAPPVVQPLPERLEGSVLTLIALAVLGLTFFGGGIFWASYARPTLEPHLFGPRLVGGLAGIAGVGFFVVAVYLLLDRLGRAAEHQARHRP